MRLLDTVTGQFVEKNPREPTTKYAILSHTWYPEGEQTYQELRDIQKCYASECQHLQYPSQYPSSAAPPNQAQFLPPASHTQPSVYPPLTNSVAPASELPTSSASNQSEPPLSSIWHDPHLSFKIRGACEVARMNGYRYIWIDSCCIDKTSSSELSESINSMFQWYARADVCYAFLVDVPADEDHAAQGSHFRRSYWFTRGWTLQELIAPARVVFFSLDWAVIGSKHRLASLIAEITRIRYNALLRVELLSAFSVAERLSWASTRFTTRVEDRAYSLLGLFDIAMPTLYGEGDRAFLRLQEEIMRRIPDQSLFAWTLPYHNDSLRQFPHLNTVGTSRTLESRYLFSCKHYSGIYTPSLLAASLRAFSVGWNIDAVSHDEISRRLHPYLARLPAADFNFTPYGIRTQLPLIPLSVYFPAESGIAYPDDSEWYLAILGCEHKDFAGQLLGRVCYIPPSASDVEFLCCGYVSIPGASWTSGEVHSFDLLPLSPEIISGLRLPHVPQVVLKTVYISHTLHRDDGALDVARRQPHETIILVLSKKMRDALSAQGYAAKLQGPDQDHPVTHSLTLSCDKHVIAIRFLHTLEHDGRRLTVTAKVSLSAPPPHPASQASTESGSYRAYPAILSWTDSLVSPWNMNLTNGGNEVILSTPGAEDVVIVLKLRFATTDHYLLCVEFLKASESSTALPAEVEVEASPVRSRREHWSRSWLTGATLAPASSESSHQAAGTGGEARVPSL